MRLGLGVRVHLALEWVSFRLGASGALLTGSVLAHVLSSRFGRSVGARQARPALLVL